MIIVKVLAILGIIVGIYFFIEEQLDINLNSAKMEGKDGENANSSYLESVTGASLDEQLIEVLLMISSCLKAGRNLDQAFELVAVSTPPPICNEFRTLVQERRLGVPMVEALTNLGNRVPSQDLRLAVNATIFQQETGGNLEDLYTQILLTISERKKIMGKIVAGTAHARLSGNLVATIPVILAIVLLYMQPDYLKPMLTNPYGQIALLISVTATILGVIFINRMTTSILPDAEEAIISKNESSLTGKKKYRLLRMIISPLSVLVSFLPAKFTNKLKNETRFLLNASGKSNEFEVDEFIGLMVLSTIIFGLIMLLFVSPVSMGGWAWLVLLCLLPIGFRLPRIYLAHLIRKRQKNIEFELPYVIDLLSLAIESGLDLTGGIAKVVEKSRNTDIVVEFKMFLADIKVGKSMEEALADMAERVKVLSFFSFVSSLIQAQRLGADIGPTLRAQAEQMRYQRLILAEERVNKLPVKLLIPLVFFVFPSISVLLIGPAIIQIQTKFPKPEHAESNKNNNENVKNNAGILKKETKEQAKVVTPSETKPKETSVLVNSSNNKIDMPILNKNENLNEKKVSNNNSKKVHIDEHQSNNNLINNSVEKKEFEHNTETIPVVPSVTPAPIIIEEPVANPNTEETIPSAEDIKESLNNDSSQLIKQEKNSIYETFSNEKTVSDNPTTIINNRVPENNALNIYKEEFGENTGNSLSQEEDSTFNGDSNPPSSSESDSNSNLIPIEVYIGR